MDKINRLRNLKKKRGESKEKMNELVMKEWMDEDRIYVNQVTPEESKSHLAIVLIKII